MEKLRIRLITILIVLFCIDRSNAVPSLQQTIPSGDADVCPGETVQYTCIAENGLIWKALDAADMPVQYTTLLSMINDTGDAGVFNTKLTDISGTTLTSTATIENVSLEYNGKNISCQDLGGPLSKVVQTEEPPSSPNNLAATVLNSAGNDKATVNFTWFENNSRCVVLYHVQGNSAISSISTNTTSQYLELLLNIGEEYSFRVRGIDTANRPGNWSAYFMYSPIIITPSLTISTPTTQTPTTQTPTTSTKVMTTTTRILITESSKVAAMTSSIVPPTITMTPMSGLSGGAIAGIVVGTVVGIGFVVLVAVIIIAIICIKVCRNGNYNFVPNNWRCCC